MQQTVLCVNHPDVKCGVHQYGAAIFHTIQSSVKYRFVYAECRSLADLRQASESHHPAAIIYNYYPSTMPWLTRRFTRWLPLPQLGVMHEVTQARADCATETLFDFHISPDPTVVLTNPIVFKTGRLIPAYTTTASLPETPTFGSFGFGTTGKGFNRIVDAVQREYDNAVIRLNITSGRFGDADGSGAREYGRRCRDAIRKPGIHLEVTHDFLSAHGLLDWLSANTINCFFYEPTMGRGISSAIDMALSVDRPLAVTSSSMFRNLRRSFPLVSVECTTLRDIMSRGTRPLERYKKEWTAENIRWDYERIVSQALERYRPRSAVGCVSLCLGVRQAVRVSSQRLWGKSHSSDTLDGIVSGIHADGESGGEAATAEGVAPPIVEEACLNRVLDDSARCNYAAIIGHMTQICPAEMSRKLPRANVQQAFVHEAIRNLSRSYEVPRILFVGCYEDTAFMCLEKSGLGVDGIDPLINYDLETFITKPKARSASYDLIAATSVLEHVEKDEEFVHHISELLSPGGVAIFTCDFQSGYRSGAPKPSVDCRLYTIEDLTTRLVSAMDGCALHGRANWYRGEGDFVYEGIRYGFATFVVQKQK